VANFINDPFAPNCVLLINDIELEERLMNCISDITFEDESDGASSLTFNVSYQMNIIGGISTDILRSKIFSPGNKVVLRGGYGIDVLDIGAGYIAEIEPNFSEDAPPSFRVVCYDKLHTLSLMKSETGRSWISSWRDSQIATFIGSEAGFVISQTESASLEGIRKTRSRYGEQPRVQKRGESHYSFLRSLADQNGFELACRWDGKASKFRLYFEPAKDQTKPLFIFEYGSNSTYPVSTVDTGELVGSLLSFTPRFSITSQFTKYRAYSVNPQGEEIAHTMTLDEFVEKRDAKFGGLFAEELTPFMKGSTGGGADTMTNAFGEVIEVVSTKIFDNRQQANEYLKMHMRKLARDFLSGPASIKGNQYIQSRQVHEFRGLGPLFDGKYYVKTAKHNFTDSGYSTTIDVRKTTPEEKTQ